MKTTPYTGHLIHVAVVECDPRWFVGLQWLIRGERDLQVTSVRFSEIETTDKVDVAIIQGNGQYGPLRVAPLKRMRSGLRIIVAGSDGNDEIVLKALECGAKAYLTRPPPQRL